MFNCRCLGQTSGAAGVDIDHGVIIAQILLSDDLCWLAGQLCHEVRHSIHVCDGVRRVELHVRGQLSPDLGYSLGCFLGEDDSLALNYSESVQQGALKMFCYIWDIYKLQLQVTCLRLLLISAGVTPTIPRPIQ